MVPKPSSKATSLYRGRQPPSLRTPPGWGHGDTALGPSREAHGLGANGS